MLDAAHHWSRGAEYERNGKQEKALAEYSEAIRLDPTDATACSFRISLYEKMGAYDKAIADCTAIINCKQNPPADPVQAREQANEITEALFERSRFHRKIGEQAKATADDTEARRTAAGPLQAPGPIPVTSPRPNAEVIP